MMQLNGVKKNHTFSRWLMAIAGIFVCGCLHAWDLDGKKYVFEQVADHVYVMHGPLQEPNVANKGFMNNPSFIEGEKSVVVIDPGSSLYAGQQVIKEIQKITKKPIKAVFNSHIHGDHWLANDAIVRAYPDVKIYAHPEMIKQAKGEQGKTWVDIMNRSTKDFTADTKLVVPNLAVDAETPIEIDEMRFKVMHNGRAHTDTDIIVLYPKAKVAFMGDLLFNGRLGRFDNSSNIEGNLEILKAVKDSGTEVYVPGHGHTGSYKDVVAPFYSYLSRLIKAVDKGIEEDLEDYEIKEASKAQFNRYEKWPGFEENFGRHIIKRYAEKEAF